MLPIETPSGPSSLNDREEAEPVGLGDTQTPNFSIRDYVFNCRSKDIAVNWPFPQQFLELCLKHGFRDPLPPFEPPDPVRGWCSRKAVEPEQPASCSNQTSEKKCRSIGKLSSITEINQTEDILSTSSTLSDSMASKVCPVCKVFASSSNTTLNAHIDQCLSADNNIEPVVTEVGKPKMKPIKKRLLVDIYATAPHSTIEDLDRRNGTNWASELGLVAQTSKACNEFKRPTLSHVDTRDGEKPAEVREDGNEGAVYVDSNGIKLRILSKFKDIPPVMPREHFKVKKHATKMKQDKSLLISKKKYMKVKPQTKKLGEIQVEPEGDYAVPTHMEKEESPYKISNIPDQINSNGSSTLRHWVCAKRSDIPRKLNRKDINDSSAEESCNLKFSKPSEDLTYFPKTKRGDVDSLSNNVEAMERGKSPTPPAFIPSWSSKNASTSGLMLKLSRSLGRPDSSPTRREEIQISDHSHCTTILSRESSHLSLKTKNSLSMKTNALFGEPSSLEGSKDDESNKLSSCKRFRKRRSILGSGKQGGSPSNNGLDVVRAKRTTRTTRSGRLEGISRSTTHEIMDRESPSSTNISESEEEEDASAMENQKYNTDVTCQDPELLPSNIQVSLEPSMAKSNVDPVGGVSVISSSTDLEPRASMDEHMHTVSAQDSSACLTSYQDLSLEIPLDNSSTTSVRKTCGQDQHLVTLEEPSGSPVSTTSTFSPAYFKDSEVKDPEMNPLMKPSVQDEFGSAIPCVTNLDGTEERTIERRNHQVKAFPQAKEPERYPNDQPCCCLRNEGLSGHPRLWRERAMAGGILPSGGKQIPNLYIPASVSSSLNYCPSSEANAVTTPILVSPTESVTTWTNFSSPSPPPRSQTQSTSNSVLRLMGKDLMVAKREESTQQPVVYPGNDNPSGSQWLRPPAFASTYWGCIPYHHNQLPGGSAAFGQATPYMVRHHMPLKESVYSSPTNTMKEVIVIRDSPEFSESRRNPTGSSPSLPGLNLMQQRPLSGFPSEAQFFSRDVTNARGIYPNGFYSH